MVLYERATPTTIDNNNNHQSWDLHRNGVVQHSLKSSMSTARRRWPLVLALIRILRRGGEQVAAVYELSGSGVRATYE